MSGSFSARRASGWAGRTPRPLDWLVAELEAGRYALVALLAAMACAAVYLFLVTRHAGFYQDEWSFFYDRRGLSADDVFQPYVDNLAAIPILIYQAAIKAFGFGGAHLPIRLLWIGTVLGGSLLLFLYLRRRTLPWFAFFPSCLLLVFGAAWTDQATSLGLVRLSAVVAGLGALVALDSRSFRADLCASALLAVALVSHSAALPFVVGAATTVALRGVPEVWRRAWIWAVPLMIYLAWLAWAHLTYPGAPIDLANVTQSPRALLDGNATVLAGIGGRYLTNDAGRIYALDHDPEIPITLLLGGWIALLALRRRLPREALVGLSTLVAYWLIVALVISPARQPTADRYLYVGAVLLAITLAPLLPRRSPPLIAWLAIAVTFVALSLAPNIRAISQSAENVEMTTDETRAGLTAIELARGTVAAGFSANAAVPEFQGGLYLPSTAGAYLATVDRYGSPGLSEEELLQRDNDARSVADAVLVSALDLRLRAASGSSTDTSGPECWLRPVEAGGVVTAAPGTRIMVIPETAAGVQVAAARFADTPTISLGQVDDGRPAVLTIPRDRGTRAWRLSLVGSATVRVCTHPTGSAQGAP